jgi:hypothetical protein
VWRRFRKKWLNLPAHIRKGLLRLSAAIRASVAVRRYFLMLKCFINPAEFSVDRLIKDGPSKRSEVEMLDRRGLSDMNAIGLSPNARFGDDQVRPLMLRTLAGVRLLCECLPRLRDGEVFAGNLDQGRAVPDDSAERVLS